MNLTKKQLQEISEKFGDTFYLLDADTLRKNYLELDEAFRSIYSKFKISYSYKTNYIPEVCKIIDGLGGYAEVVSDMECELAERIGVKLEHIVLNGPCKKKETIQKLLLNNGIVNIDSKRDFLIVKEIAEENSDYKFGIGIRCNFEVGDNVVSRFGIDVTSREFSEILSEVKKSKNIWIRGMHCHFASRNLSYWPARTEKMLRIVEEYLPNIPEYISLGGGIFGRMPESLKSQFDSDIPEYSDYAEIVATAFQNKYGQLSENKKPLLMLEPGSAIAGDILNFACKVLNIKDIRGKKIATVLGSMYNINPTLNKKNPPLTVVPMGSTVAENYNGCDIAGYTCIESDYLYRGYQGELAEGDYMIFGNVGSYSVVLKPPFILPNFPVVELREGNIKEIKRKETFDDIFQTYRF